MIKEALQYLVGLAEPKQITHEGLVYTDKGLHRITPPSRDKLDVGTLKGLTDAIQIGFEGLKAGSKVVLHVISPTKVHLLASESDPYGRRQIFVLSDCEDRLPRFVFGQFLSAEQFIIALQAYFVPSVGDIDYLLQTTASLTTENVATSTDDGITQRTALRKGVILKEDATIKARVKLAPYRTFREVEQPVSEFLFRLRPVDGQIPQCAIFEADGGKWRLDAMDLIATWLSRNTEKVTVIS